MSIFEILRKLRIQRCVTRSIMLKPTKSWNPAGYHVIHVDFVKIHVSNVNIRNPEEIPHPMIPHITHNARNDEIIKSSWISWNPRGFSFPDTSAIKKFHPRWNSELIASLTICLSWPSYPSPLRSGASDENENPRQQCRLTRQHENISSGCHVSEISMNMAQ